MKATKENSDMTLQMTAEEAARLMDVVASIGGDMYALSSKVYFALSEADIKPAKDKYTFETNRYGMIATRLTNPQSVV
jgi:hypothetical protein